MEATFTFTVNGRRQSVTTDPQRPLLEVLREELHLTGTKYGCGEGSCRACTVLLNGKRTLACQTAVSEADNKDLLTIEGLERDGTLHPVQQVFQEEKAFQCGYCTPGMVLSTVALLKEKPRPSEQEIVSWMNPHLCRCNHYPQILKAVRRAAL